MVQLGSTMKRNRPPKRWEDHHSHKFKQLGGTIATYAAIPLASSKLTDIAQQYILPNIEGWPEGLKNLTIATLGAAGTYLAVFGKNPPWKPNGPIHNAIQKHIFQRYERRIREEKKVPSITNWLIYPAIAAAAIGAGESQLHTIDSVKNRTEHVGAGLQAIVEGGETALKGIGDGTAHFLETFTEEGRTTQQETPTPTTYSDEISTDSLYALAKNRGLHPTRSYTTQSATLLRDWRTQIQETEQQEGIPENILATILKHESYANYIQLPHHNGTEAGIGQIVLTTGKELGLNVIDKRQGETNAAYKARLANDIEEALGEGPEALESLLQRDQRLDPRIAIPAAGRHLSNLKERHGTWDKAIAAYNRAGNTDYQRMIEELRRNTTL